MLQDISEQEKVPKSDSSHSGYWIFHPAVISALLSAVATMAASIVPALVTAQRQGIALEKVPLAREQVALWQKNSNCLVSEKPITISPTQGTRMQALMCPTGDILLTQNPSSQDSNKAENNQWISFTSLQGSNTNVPDNIRGFLIKKAVAATLISSAVIDTTSTQANQLAQGSTVICTKGLEEGRLLRRVRLANGECWDEIVNTFTGSVINREKGTCDSNCS